MNESMNTADSRSEPELGAEELEQVTGGVNPNARIGILTTDADRELFLKQAVIYCAEMNLPMWDKPAMHAAEVLNYVVPKMVIFCKTQPRLMHLSYQDIYDVTEYYLRFIYMQPYSEEFKRMCRAGEV